MRGWYSAINNHGDAADRGMLMAGCEQCESGSRLKRATQDCAARHCL